MHRRHDDLDSRCIELDAARRPAMIRVQRFNTGSISHIIVPKVRQSYFVQISLRTSIIPKTIRT